MAISVVGSARAQIAPGPAALAPEVGQPQVPTGGAPAGGAIAPSGLGLDQAMVLGVGDVADVGLVGQSEYAARVRVSTDGTVVLPLVGKVKALGLTAAELSENVRGLLIKGGYYSDPITRVEIVGITSRYITVLGNVTTPGLLPLDRRYRLSDIVARVGAKAVSSGGYVVLTPADGKPQRYMIADLAMGTKEQDPIVSPGDKLYVPEAENEVFYISGQVKTPGSYPVVAGLTMRMAIAKAGGVTEMGNEKKITMYRGEKKVPKVKLEDKVLPGDIVTIGERLF